MALTVSCGALHVSADWSQVSCKCLDGLLCKWRQGGGGRNSEWQVGAIRSKKDVGAGFKGLNNSFICRSLWSYIIALAGFWWGWGWESRGPTMPLFMLASRFNIWFPKLRCVFFRSGRFRNVTPQTETPQGGRHLIIHQASGGRLWSPAFAGYQVY